ncbi:MAG: hypothetical protein N2712_05790 [Brevinematales bacterium]|nr:hypothetical protein [Brevinematales bacterium]
MKREIIERYQVFYYLFSVIVGLTFGLVLRDLNSTIEVLIWICLGFLLYLTFVQVPILSMRDAFLDIKFILAAIIGNFFILPIVVWVILLLLPNDIGIRLGVILVLLVPCTDWFITFSHLGKGDTKLAIVFTPISLVLQVILLPVYVFIFLGRDIFISFSGTHILRIFGFVILLPLLMAFLTQYILKSRERSKYIDKLSLMTIPTLSVIIFLISSIQAGLVFDKYKTLLSLVPIFFMFLAVSLVISKFLSAIFRLSAFQSRVIAFSLGTRNSFVVLPLALALPEPFKISSVIVIFQSLVELLGMIFYIWFVPQKLFHETDKTQHNR